MLEESNRIFFCGDFSANLTILGGDSVFSRKKMFFEPPYCILSEPPMVCEVNISKTFAANRLLLCGFSKVLFKKSYVSLHFFVTSIAITTIVVINDL